jgi:isopentenyl-diphosphate delta-isomerase
MKVWSWRRFSNVSSGRGHINLGSKLAQNEKVLIVDEHDEPVRAASRLEMRQQNLWHRSTSIFVVNRAKEFVVQKRSTQKDYCPGYLDLAAGGVVGMADGDVDESARREVQEELGIEGTKPKYLLKFSYQDDYLKAWNYVYVQLLLDGVKLKP